MEFESVLDHIAADRGVLAKFVHTLSFLEYIGARKILKSQNAQTMSLEILAHASEEIRHAKALKQLAEEIAERSLGGYHPKNMICGTEAEIYFQSVDRQNDLAAQGDAEVSYALTTLLVEERAMKLYPILGVTLARHGFPGRVAGILKEEERHLNEVRARLPDEATVSCGRAYEESAFQHFMKGLACHLDIVPFTSKKNGALLKIDREIYTT